MNERYISWLHERSCYRSAKALLKHFCDQFFGTLLNPWLKINLFNKQQSSFCLFCKENCGSFQNSKRLFPLSPTPKAVVTVNVVHFYSSSLTLKIDFVLDVGDKMIRINQLMDVTATTETFFCGRIFISDAPTFTVGDRRSNYLSTYMNE